jgi:hypothetical protein
MENRIVMTEMEETRKRIRELEDDLAEEYGAHGKLEWYDVHECFPDEVITYSGSTASFFLHDGCEVAESRIVPVSWTVY